MNLELKELRKLTSAAFEVQRAKMAAILADERRLTDQLLLLSDREAEARNRLATISDAATLSGSTLLWQGWIETRKRSLNEELARLRAVKSDLDSDLRKAFGKSLAMDRMTKNAIADEQRERERRAAWSED